MSSGTVSIPLVLPRLRRSEMLAINQIVRQGKKHTVAIAGQDWQLSLEPWLNAAPVMPAGKSDWYAKLDWAGATIQISMPESVCQGWLKEAFPDLDVPALPQAFSAALLESLLTDLIDTPALAQRGPVQLQSIGHDETLQNTSLPHQFGIYLERDAQRIYANLSADNLGLMLIAGVVGEKKPGNQEADTAIHEAPAALPVTTRVQIGQSRLELSEFLELQPGDTVLIAHSWVSQDRSLWIGSDEIGFRARIDENHVESGSNLQLIVSSPLEHKGVLMATDQPAEDDQKGVLEHLPVQLVFEIGTLTWSLGELNALAPGKIIELNRPLPHAVDIRVNGMLVGRGDLVEIDGHLGVTISELQREKRDAAAPNLPQASSLDPSAEPVQSAEKPGQGTA
jgi:type III secretion protein Q